MSEGFSIIVPFLNEEETIGKFCVEIDQYAKTVEFPIEVVFVDDGSKDRSVDIIKKYVFNNIDSAKIVRLSKNFGSHAAIRAGIKNIRYGMCTWFGADLQDPFEIISIAFDKITNGGVDIVCFGRTSTDVPTLTKFFSGMYSRLIRKYAVERYEENGIQTIAYNKKIIDYLNNNVETNSSIGLQILNAGFDMETVLLDFKAREAGKSKWTFSKKVKLAIDSFVSYSFLPIRMVSIVGMMLFITGVVGCGFTVVYKLLNPLVPAGYSTLICVLVLGFGITNISLGIIAEYLWRTLDAARKRPAFIISDLISCKVREKNED